MKSDLILLSRLPLEAAFKTATSSGIKESERLEETCSEMESLFIQCLLKEMRATVPKSEFLSGGKAEEMYASILDAQLAKEISTRGEIGISSMLYRQLNDLQNQNGTEQD